MKKIFLTVFAFIVVFTLQTKAQEKYGSTLNLGIGAGYYGYYGYAGRTSPVLNVNYEFDVNKNFTLAPSVGFYSYSSRYFYDRNNRFYNYRETVIPIAIKGTYYFDQIFDASSDWDFYLAGSLGFAVVNAYWDNDYPGDRTIYRAQSPLFIDLHLGTEYHFNENIGAFVDFSTGVSTIGLAIH